MEVKVPVDLQRVYWTLVQYHVRPSNIYDEALLSMILGKQAHLFLLARCAIGVVIGVLVLIRTALGAEDLNDIRLDTDPTKPVLVSLRDEYFNLERNASINQMILRMDRVFIPNVRLLGGAKGGILRVDLPYVTADNGRRSSSGIGDIYGQFLMVPALRRGFTVAYGAGLAMPTADDRMLGTEKWILAPAVVPAQFFPGRPGFAFIKFQEYVSVAGEDDRTDIHQLRITPTVLYRFTKRFYGLVDTDSRTDWLRSRTDFTSGMMAGWMLSPRWGTNLKLEIPWGEYRSGEWTLKSTLFHTRY